MAHGFRMVPKDRKHAPEYYFRPAERPFPYLQVTPGTAVTPTPVIPLEEESSDH